MGARALCARLFLGVILGWLGSAAAGGEGQPLPHLADPVYQFADTVSGDEVKHVFLIANPTQAALRITRVRTSCGCTVGQVVPETIPAGGKGQLEVVFKTAGRAGLQRKHIFVSTDHPAVPLLECSIEGNLLAPADQAAEDHPRVRAAAPATDGRLLVASADKVDFGEFWIDETPVLEVTLTNPSRQAVRLRRVTSGSSSISLVCPARDLAPGASTILRIQVQRSSEERQVNESILVETDPAGPSLRLPVLGHARPRLICTPETVNLPDARVGTAVRRTVTLTSQDGKAFAVESCRTTLAGLTVSATPGNDQRTTWQLTLLFDPQTPSRRPQGYVTVATDRPGTQPRIRISGDISTP